jgi:hypothetical protein
MRQIGYEILTCVQSHTLAGSRGAIDEALDRIWTEIGG